MKLASSFLKNVPIFQYLAMLTGALSVMTTGMIVGWPSISLPKFFAKDTPIPITNEQGSWMAVMPLLGGIGGNYLSLFIVDRIGRRRAIILSTFPSFASWITVAYAPSVAAILVARFVAGIADGLAFFVLPMYLGEIANPKIRGFLGSSVPVAWIFGILLINVIGTYLDMTATALVASAAPLLCLLTFSWMPESPYYLIMKGKMDEARRSLRIFKRTDDVGAELDRLTEAVRKTQENCGKYKDLFTVKSNRRALFVMLATRGAQQLSGVTAITFYATTIFEGAGSPISSHEVAMLYFSMQMVSCVLSSLIVDKTGRRPLLIASIAGAGLALFVEGVYFLLQNATTIDTTPFSLVPAATLIVFVIVFSLGMQTIPICLVGEIFPMNVKAFASLLGNDYFCILATLMSKYFQFTKDRYGLHVPFFTFAAFCLLGLILTVVLVPETAGKTLEDIQLELKGERLSERPEKSNQITKC